MLRLQHLCVLDRGRYHNRGGTTGTARTHGERRRAGGAWSTGGASAFRFSHAISSRLLGGSADWRTSIGSIALAQRKAILLNEQLFDLDPVTAPPPHNTQQRRQPHASDREPISSAIQRNKHPHATTTAGPHNHHQWRGKRCFLGRCDPTAAAASGPQPSAAAAE